MVILKIFFFPPLTKSPALDPPLPGVDTGVAGPVEADAGDNRQVVFISRFPATLTRVIRLHSLLEDLPFVSALLFLTNLSHSQDPFLSVL